jgi:hypothetical protein
LVELLISIGVLSTISLGVAYNIANIYQQQNMVTNVGEAKNFSNNLVEYLSSAEFCENELLNTPFQANMNRNLVVRGMGDMKDAGNASGTIQANSQLAENIMLRNLTIENKTGITPQQVFYQNANANLRAVRVTVSMAHRSMDNSQNNVWTDLKPKFIDIPVLTAGGRIVACGMNAGLDEELTCTQIGSVWDASRNVCEPREQCNLRGTYTQWTCSPAYGGCGGNVSNLIGGSPGGIGGGGKSPATVGGIPNPVTGQLNCPPRATPEISGVREATYVISCGKKCSQTITETTRFYVCMECS